ncbi:winged helix-turn-helix domain-containing protein [Tateyamaria sp. SN3-11]|uniref:winged helix-turn-helix domain-containing protein n=1 Tax=Tateyamaria sp. SN3-11 TaxID=3092147 RepID=UPI0039EB22EB
MNSFEFENYRFDGDRCELFRDDELVPLEPQISHVLHILLKNAGTIVTRDALLDEVWRGKSVSSSVIDNRIRAARRAVRDDGRTQRLIKTFMNEGYKFVGDVTMIAGEALHQPNEVTPAMAEGARAKRFPFLKPALYGILALVAAVPAFMLLSPFQFGSQSGLKGEEIPNTAQLLVDEGETEMIVAVLPFTTTDGSLRAIAADLHLAQSLIDVLSTIPDIKVVSALSSFRFQNTDASPNEISEALGTNHLVSGSFSEVGGQLSVTIRMTEAQSGIVKWTHALELPRELAQAEPERAKAIRTAALNFLNSLGVTSNLSSEQLVAPEAHNDYEQASRLLQSRDGPLIIDAINRLERVIATEPDFVPAYTAIILAYHRANTYSGLTNVAVARAIDKYIDPVTRIAPDSPDVLVALGLQARYHDRLPLELQYYDRALASDPNNERAIVLRADVLRRLGRVRASEEAFEKALSFDPLSPELLSRVARAKFEKRAIREAFIFARQNLRWNSQDVEALTDLALFSRETGEYGQAFLLLRDALSISPESYDAQFQMLLLLRSIGQIQQFECYIASPALRVLGHTLAGDEAKARASLLEDPLGQFSGFLSYTFGDSTPLYEFLNTAGIYSEFKGPSAEISTTFLFDSVFYADVNRKNADPDTQIIFENIRRYFETLPLEGLVLEEEYIALAGLHALEGNDTALLATVRAAVDNGFVFIGTLERSPVFENIRRNAELQPLIEEMRVKAGKEWGSISSQMDREEELDSAE